jgi:poly(A) polymerase
MDVYKAAKHIVSLIVEQGYIAYFAGGWVRDFVQGHPSSDIDIATDCPMPTLLNLFPNALLVGVQFGVIVLPYEGHLFEIATFRKDLSYTNGRSPDQIEKATAEEDAQRRDFTINGLFFDPLEEKIYDYVGGLDDLKKGILRAIGDPFERFQEDRLRMVRAVRFHSRFLYPIELKTEEAIQNYAPELLPAVKPERIYQELTKMEKEGNFNHALRELFRLGLLKTFVPSLEKVHLKDFEERLKKMRADTPFALKLAVIVNTFEEKMALFDFLKAPNRDKDLILLYEKAKKLKADHEWAEFFAHPDSEAVLKALHIWEEKQRDIKRLEFYVSLHQNKEKLITASDLMALGIKPGKNMGHLLKKAEALACDKQLKDKSIIIKELEKDPLWQP